MEYPVRGMLSIFTPYTGLPEYSSSLDGPYWNGVPGVFRSFFHHGPGTYGTYSSSNPNSSFIVDSEVYPPKKTTFFPELTQARKSFLPTPPSPAAPVNTAAGVS
eukprot:752246-Hanusia_phi.AAC.5